MVTTWLTGAIRAITGPSRLALAAILAGAATVLMCLAGAPAARAATAPVSLGAAASYGVLAREQLNAGLDGSDARQVIK